jgi:hypothetical protein
VTGAERAHCASDKCSTVVAEPLRKRACAAAVGAVRADLTERRAAACGRALLWSGALTKIGFQNLPEMPSKAREGWVVVRGSETIHQVTPPARVAPPTASKA